MRIHNPLDKILNSEFKVRILRFLGKSDAEWSGRQIAKTIGASPATCHKELKELSEEKVVLLKTVGRSYLYRLNKDNLSVAELLKPLYEKESKIVNGLYKAIIEKIPGDAKSMITSIAVFGSVQRKEERASSDIDLLVLVKRREDKKPAEDIFSVINEAILSRFGNVIAAYIQTVEEFKTGHAEKLGVTENIIKSHELIYGKPLRELI